MKGTITLLLASRKAFVALTTMIAATLITLVGVSHDMNAESLLGLLGAFTGIAWKLMDTIAMEDNAQRELEASENERKRLLN